MTTLPAAALPCLPLQLLLQGPQPLLPVAKFTGVAEVVVQLLLPGRPASLHNTPHTQPGCLDGPRERPRPPGLAGPHPPLGASQTAPSASEIALASGHPRPSAQTSADLHTGTRRRVRGPQAAPESVTGRAEPHVPVSALSTRDAASRAWTINSCFAISIRNSWKRLSVSHAF